jgi:hypothetical protein
MPDAELQFELSTNLPPDRQENVAPVAMDAKAAEAMEATQAAKVMGVLEAAGTAEAGGAMNAVGLTSAPGAAEDEEDDIPLDMRRRNPVAASPSGGAPLSSSSVGRRATAPQRMVRLARWRPCLHTPLCYPKYIHAACPRRQRGSAR